MQGDHFADRVQANAEAGVRGPALRKQVKDPRQTGYLADVRAGRRPTTSRRWPEHPRHELQAHEEQRNRQPDDDDRRGDRPYHCDEAERVSHDGLPSRRRRRRHFVPGVEPVSACFAVGLAVAAVSRFSVSARATARSCIRRAIRRLRST